MLTENYIRRHGLFFAYLLIGLFLFFGSYPDRIARAQFIGNTVYLPLTLAVNEYKNVKKLEAENHIQQLIIADQMLKIIEAQTKLQKFENSIINFEIAETSYVFADVVGFSGDFFGRTLIISKGKMDGIEADQAVFSTQGIVGKVIVANQNFSVVLPINHSNFKLAVLNKNSGVQGILMADVYSNIAIEYMKFGSNIAVGDTVVTSNLSQIFPPNFPVGTIIRLEESSDALYFRAIVRPFTEIGNLQNVYILNREKTYIEVLNNDF
jgi:rod shape-determining protein MreC